MQVVKPELITTTGNITRSGTATYYDKDGILQTAATGVLRFGYDPVTKEFIGLLFENSATNICLQSEALDNASWVKTAGTSVSTTNATSPANTATADIITTTGAGGVYQVLAVSASTNYVFSLSVKLGTMPASSYTIAIYNATASSWIVQDAALDFGSSTLNASTWSRGQYAFSTPAGCTSVHIYAFRNSSSITSCTVSLWGMQLELGSVSTSYIQTNGSTATRNAEVLTGSGLLYTSATNAYSEWSSAGVSYTIGQQVSVGTYNNSTTGISISDTASGTYKCLVNHTSSVSNGPLQSTTNWVRVGPTNQFAVFDTKVSTQTTATSELTFVFRASSLDAIALLNLAGSSAAIGISEVSRSNTYRYNVLDRAVRYLAGNQSFDWYSYFFYDADTTKTQAVFTSLTASTDNLVTVRLSGVGTVAIGIETTGKVKTLGGTQYGASTGIIDYSRKETDEFGNTSLVVRNYSKRMNAQVFLTNANLNRVQRLLYSIRATPVLWIGSTDSTFEEPLVVLGYYKDFDTEIAYPAHSLCNLQIEGLI